MLSIFVNPTQFGPNEDLAKYPRDLEGDLAMAGARRHRRRLRPDGRGRCTRPASRPSSRCASCQQGLCGDRRPGHFAGVATVVTKLFTIVRPHLAVFGEKDFQQLAVVRRLMRDLNLGVEIVGLPTVREPDGLAMSSRNRYLSPADRARALSLSRALQRREAVGGRGRARRRRADREGRARSCDPAVDKLDYVEIRNADTLAPMRTSGRARR